MKKKLLSLVCALALTISLLPAAQALEGEGTRAAEALASLGLVTSTGAGYAAEKPPRCRAVPAPSIRCRRDSGRGDCPAARHAALLGQLFRIRFIK